MAYLPNSVAEATRLWAQVAQIALEAQMVIGMRMAGMWGVLPQPRDEPHRMVLEKLDAAQEAGAAAFHAVSHGAPPHLVVAAALRPYGRRTRANAHRLTRAANRKRA